MNIITMKAQPGPCMYVYACMTVATATTATSTTVTKRLVTFHSPLTRIQLRPSPVPRLCYRLPIVSTCCACCRMAEEEERRKRVATDQQAATLARGKAAAEHSRLHSNARHTHAQLAAAQHAQRAQQIKSLNADRPAQLGMR